MTNTNRFDITKLWTYLFLFFLALIPLALYNVSLYVLIFFVVSFLLIYKFNIPKYGIFIFIIAITVRLFIIFSLDTPPASDFAVLLNASRSLINGDLSFLEDGYFKLWSYQMGFVYFQSLLLRIWDSIIILKLFNCLVCAATVCLIYLIAREFVCEKAAQVASLLYCFFAFPLFYVTVLTNQFLASFLIYFGLYIVIAKGIKLSCFLRYLIFAVLLAFSNVIRPESIIPLFSAVIFLVITVNKSSWKKNLLNVLILVGTYYLLFNLISNVFVWTGLSPNGLTNNAPLWKFVLGFNHETNGMYTDNDGAYLLDQTAALQIVKERVFVSAEELFDLFKNKVVVFWGGQGIEWSLEHTFGGWHNLLNKSMWSIYLVLNNAAVTMVMLLYVLCIIGIAKYSKQSNRDTRILLFINQVFVTFGVYLLIEVQGRYAYHVQISLAVLAALGIAAISDKIKQTKRTE